MSDLQQRIADVQENMRKLERCKGHRFAPIPEHGKKLFHIGMHFKCVKCKATANLMAVSWYRRGVEHAKGDVEGVTTVPWFVQSSDPTVTE